MKKLTKMILAIALLSTTQVFAETRFFIGDHIVNDLGIAGVVLEVLADGQVSVRYDNEREPRRLYVSELARASGCDGDYCVGERIVDENGFGVVEGFYLSGEVIIHYDDGRHFRTTRDKFKHDRRHAILPIENHDRAGEHDRDLPREVENNSHEGRHSEAPEHHEESHSHDSGAHDAR